MVLAHGRIWLSSGLGDCGARLATERLGSFARKSEDKMRVCESDVSDVGMKSRRLQFSIQARYDC